MTASRECEETPAFADIFRGPTGHSLLPGGFGRGTFAIAPRTPMAVRGSDYRLWDDAGRELIDLNNNFTSLIHGNANPEVVAAVQRALRDGTCFGLPSMFEVDHAQLLVERLAAVEQVRYTNSGTEGVMLAVRIARAATGRDRVVFIRSAYHGHSDLALVPGGERSRRGVPAGVIDDILEVPINDVEALTAVFADHGPRIAAVVVDPMPNRAGLIKVSADFLAMARNACTRHGALLVSDEVIALRQAYAGAAVSLGVVPDLIVLGKIIGGGLPIGAVAGPAEVMAELNPLRQDALEHGGTFAGNPITMTAGLAAMRLYTSAEVDRLNALGERARTTLSGEVSSAHWEVRGDGSLFRLFPIVDDHATAQLLQTSLWWAAYDNGVLLTQNNLAAISTPMTSEVVDDVVVRLAEAAVQVEEVTAR